MNDFINASIHPSISLFYYSIIFILGGLAVLWLVAWALLTSDSPENHPRIQEHERKYIVTNIGYKPSNKVCLTKRANPWD